MRKKRKMQIDVIVLRPVEVRHPLEEEDKLLPRGIHRLLTQKLRQRQQRQRGMELKTYV